MRAPAVLAVLAALSADLAFAQTIWRVEDDAPPGGDGLSWATAYRDLQDALAAALPGDQIWVAAGVYRPDRGTGDRDARFELPSDLAIYGGFAGTEDSLEQRAGLFEETILSGDLAGDDLPDWENRADNSATILLVDTATRGLLLDGFLIRGGEDVAATGPGNGGAGLRCLGAATIRNCRFAENRSTTAAQGGAVLNRAGSSASYLNCVFELNAGTGAAMRNRDASPLVAYCWFLNNRGNGAAMFNTGSSAHVLVFNSVFAGNSGSSASTLTFDGTGGTLVNCTISDNYSSYSGSVAIYNAAADVSLSGCVVWNNSPRAFRSNDGRTQVSYSNVQGGRSGIGNIDADPLFFNPLLHDYRLTFGSPCIDAGDNGALPPEYDTDLEGDPRFADDPNAPDTGAGTPPLVDMGAYEGPHQGIVISTTELVVAEQGSATFTVAIASNPHDFGADLWVSKVEGDPDLTLASDPHLRFNSLDFRVSQIVEIRAADDADLEEGRATFRVSWAGVDARDVEMIEKEDDRFVLDTDSVTVTEGDVETFSVALAGDPQRAVEVTVANVGGDPDLLVSDGATLYFDSGNWSLPQVVTIAAAHDADALSRSATIEVSATGVAPTTVTAFEADDDPIHVDDDCTPPGDGSPAAPLCTIQAAVDEAIDGQVILAHAGRYVENVVIDAKPVRLHSLDGTGATFLDGEGIGSVLEIVNVGAPMQISGFTIENGHDAEGGGVYAEGALEISNCVVRGNIADENGGGVCVLGNLTMRNCIVADNEARGDYGGGGGVFVDGNGTFVNCTIVNNEATGTLYGAGGGLALYYTNSVVRNSILWGNRAGLVPGGTSRLGDQIYLGGFQSGELEVESTDIRDGRDGIFTYLFLTLRWGGMNLALNPRLSSDYRLTDISPCINVGDRSAINADEVDIDGESRVLDCAVDIGADEREHFVDCDGNGVSDGCQTAKPPPMVASASDGCDHADFVTPDFQYRGHVYSSWHREGESACGSNRWPDAWYLYVPALDGVVTADAGHFYGQGGILSAHTACPGTRQNELDCDPNQIEFPAVAGEEIWLRLTPRAEELGISFTLRVTGPPAWCAGCVNPGDCNGNGVPDACDIADETSRDDDGDGVPDECVLLCPGDIDGNLRVDLVDLTRVLSGFGATFGAAFEHGDLDFDGDVDMADLQWVLSGFGTECPQ